MTTECPRNARGMPANGGGERGLGAGASRADNEWRMTRGLDMHAHYSRSHRWPMLGTWGVRGLACLLGLGLSATAVGAQSLAEVARQEAARRKAVKAQAKVYTNQDLGPDAVKPGPVAPPAAAPAPDTAAKTDDNKTDDTQDVKDEKYWRDRITAAREGLARAEVLQAAIQSRLNALQTDFANRDDPAQRATIAQDTQKAKDAMAQNQADIDKFKKEITDIQEEARKAGVPPGWLR